MAMNRLRANWRLSITPALEPERVDRGEVRLADLEDRDGWMTPFELPPNAGASAVFDPTVHRRAVEWIEPMMRNADWRKVGPYAAAIYYRLSVSDMSFGPHEVQEVIEDRDLRPTAPYETVVVERALHAAYKGLEAIVGGAPSKNDEKLRRKLAKAQLDPDAKLNVPDKRGDGTLVRFRRLESVRDTLAAHGGETGATVYLTYYDVMEAQWVLGEVIAEVVTGRLQAAT